MDADAPDFETTFFRGKVRFRGGDAQVSRFELADGTAQIVVPNDIHVRLIEQIKMPPVFEIVAPMTHVVIESGAIPSTHQIRQGHSYYRDLEARYVPLQLADAQKQMEPDGRTKKAGCLSTIVLIALMVILPFALWILL